MAQSHRDQTSEPLVIQYTNLLQKYRDPNAKAVAEFRQQHIDDRVFQERAKVLDEVFELKKSLVNS